MRSLLRRLTMAMTVAPRDRTRSTVRLVSVVVPDWLMATTSVSAIVGRRPKPDSSVAGRASTRRSDSGGKRASRGGQRLAGDGGGALADHEDPVDGARAQAGAHVVGQRLGPEGHGQPAVALDELAPQRLAEADAGDSVISFSR